MSVAADPNSCAEIVRRRAIGDLTWGGPVVMLCARTILAVPVQGLVAGVYALHGSPAPWRDAAPWLPVYGTLIDAGCLALLWSLTRREGIALIDLLGFDRRRWRNDFLFGLALIPISLAIIIASIAGSSLLVFGTLQPPPLYGHLPLLPALYAVLIWPVTVGLAEQMTYNGYALPRLQALTGSTGVAVAVVSFAWSFQHVALPLTFDPAFMLFRFLSPIPFAVFITVAYLRVRRLVPFVVAHSLMDGLGVLVGVVLPLLGP